MFRFLSVCQIYHKQFLEFSVSTSNGVQPVIADHRFGFVAGWHKVVCPVAFGKMASQPNFLCLQLFSILKPRVLNWAIEIPTSCTYISLFLVRMESVFQSSMYRGLMLPVFCYSVDKQKSSVSGTDFSEIITFTSLKRHSFLATKQLSQVHKCIFWREVQYMKNKISPLDNRSF